MSCGVDAERAERPPLDAFRVLRRRPDLELAAGVRRRAVLRLERRMREERILVVGLEHSRRARERGVDVAVLDDVGGGRLGLSFAASAAKRASLSRAASPSSHSTSSSREPARRATSCRRRSRRRRRAGRAARSSLRQSRRLARRKRRGRPATTSPRRCSRSTTLPPNTGHFAKTAYFIPGTVTSMPKSGLPLTTSGLSTPGTELADDREILRILEPHRRRGREERCLAAAAASSP